MILQKAFERQQVWILPNFAMTDYASQGKTRLYNVVHLNSCRSHMSYYTCLSRSASAAGTIILQGFEPSKITRGCSGYLRQEFREHEILDDITRLRYEGLLPNHVQGHLRNPLIRLYQTWKGTSYVPDKTDEQLRWSEHDPLELLPVVTDTPWQLVGKSKVKTAKPVTGYIPAKGSKPVTKHSLDESDLPIKKKRKTTNTSDETSLTCPLGLKWDGDDYSCAYDSFFSILYGIWKENPEKWTENFEWINKEYLGLLANHFNQVLQGSLSLELARDGVRQVLHDIDSEMFPMGEASTAVGDLAFKMLQSENTLGESCLACLHCGKTTEPKMNKKLGHKLDADYNTPSSTLRWITKIEKQTSKKCEDCLNDVVKRMSYTEVPKLVVFEYPQFDITTSHKIIVFCT